MELKVEKSNALKAWRETDNRGKALLEKLYPNVNFNNQSIMDRVKTYEDACAELGETQIDEVACRELGLNKNDIAYLKLAQIVRALNEGWVAKVYDEEKRYYPWFRHNGSSAVFRFDGSYYDCSGARAGSGSPLCFKSKELSDYAGVQFLDFWKEFIV
ncbi:hypothetical protein M2132_001013 [Dysgonomonas sp. PH5-45]|uniref:hypothetical protein n=1 Tax=unclassified Dysgonomonas TaxID=2630389 RepID=UPI0024734BB6|nr:MULTISPECIES: hypothetical protein [unclassified Dysgonomonas]MDH6354684.1 hypothetical protein [Dysgonomonas sp. PH5-45]MDH6387582.1 hypothetical protein [Dysgonomonas sp. PH5-37]